MGPEKKANGLAGARAKSTAKAAAVFLLPALILIVVYMIYPVIDTFVTSAYSWNGISSNKSISESATGKPCCRIIPSGLHSAIM